MARIPLRLDPNAAPGGPPPDDGAKDRGAPVMGYFAVGFGFLGIFTIGFVFVPLALICSVLALFMGQAVWGFVGILLAVAGFITSPKLWMIVGMAGFYAFFDSSDFLKPVLDFLNSIFGNGSGTREV